MTGLSHSGWVGRPATGIRAWVTGLSHRGGVGLAAPCGLVWRNIAGLTVALGCLKILGEPPWGLGWLNMGVLLWVPDAVLLLPKIDEEEGVLDIDDVREVRDKEELLLEKRKDPNSAPSATAEIIRQASKLM